MHPLNAYRLKKMYLPVLLSAILGIGISLIITRGVQKAAFEFDDIVIGAIIGALIMLLSEIYEIFFAKKINTKLPPFFAILTNSYIYFIIISIIAYVIIYLPDEFFDEPGDVEGNTSLNDFIIILAFCFAAIVLGQFLLLLNSFLGKGVLINIILGRFHKPKNVQKIIMMLDLKNYTSISEKIGDRKALSLLNSFYDDVSSAVVVCKGDVYRYVGDEIIVTWPLKNKIKNADSIKCFFLIKDIIEKKSDYYRKHYGIVPQYRVGFHTGEVVVGQLGSVKREITYIGDVMNTTSRIEAVCKDYETDILVSKDLMDVVEVPEDIKISGEHEMTLRGKQQSIKLYSVERV